MSKNQSRKRLDRARKSIADAIKIALKIAIQKTAEITGDLTGNKIAGKITSVSKMSQKELHTQNEGEIETPKEIYISPEKGNKLLMI